MSDDERLSFLFDDPNCVTPDEPHAHIHAAMNIGKGLSFIAQQAIDVNVRAKGGMTERGQLALGGMVAAIFLVACRQAPDWADAFLASIPADEREIIDHNAAMLLGAFPLSPLDKAMAEGLKS